MLANREESIYVALANKTMRLAWAMLKNGADYQADYRNQAMAQAA